MSISDNKGTFLGWMDTLPEAQPFLYVGILTDFLDGVRKATSLSDVNVAAGIAHARLLGKPS